MPEPKDPIYFQGQRSKLSTAMAMSTVYPAPSNTRPFYDPKSEEDVKDYFSVLGIGLPFRYAIPSFDVISVELKPIRIHGATPQGEEHIYT